MKQGFTLIELLVVVLIIGILTAIALPKYKFMVLRADTARALPVLRSMLDAQERYFMANGTYAQRFEDLDIQIPPCKQINEYTQNSACLMKDKNNVEYHIYKDGAVILHIGKDPVQERIYIYYYPSSVPRTYPHACYAATAGGDNSSGNKLCKSLGGVLLRTGTLSGCNGGQGCHYYSLP